MKAQIIQIGNSQGIRIPQVMLEESGISGEVDITVMDGGIFIRRVKKPRRDWDAVFRSFAEVDEDHSAWSSTAGDFDRKEWQW